MADLTITATSVKPAKSTPKTTLLAAQTITAGQALYQDTSVTPPVWRLADANASVTTKNASAIALTGGSTGQAVVGQTGGQISIGATVASGAIYILSATAGGIAVAADLATTMYTNIIGIGHNGSTTDIDLLFINGGQLVP